MNRQRSLRADSLLMGMSVMLAMTVVQRGIGFMRGIWFCQYMDDVALGKWAMGFGFLSLVTPMLLLGLPGALPRFVETFRGQGQLGRFLCQIVGATGLITVAVVAAMLAAAPWVGGWVFGDTQDVPLVLALAIAVVAVVAFNTTTQIVAGLRLVRVASTMQFVQSVAFTAIGVGWLYVGDAVSGLLLAFAGATVLGAVPAWWTLVRGWPTEPSRASDDQAPVAGGLWRRVLPYAMALWAMNFLSNTFELTDRYMLLHLSSGGHQVGQQLVGQYHSSMIVPALIISLATMFSGVVMPYLAADWEQGRRLRVDENLRRLLVAASIVLTLGSAATLVLAPWIYGTLLQGRYDGGLSVLAVVLVFSTWCALWILAQDYLWVAERGRAVAGVLAVGLAANLGLNGLLIPRLGLAGAVWGTLASHLVILLGTWWANGRAGFRVDRSVVWISLLPATLLAGPWAAIMCAVAMGASSEHVQCYRRELWEAARCRLGVVVRP